MTASPAIQSKIIELCQALVADGELQQARRQAEIFLADESALRLYREMASLGRALHQKQHHGDEPTDEEAERFEQLQDDCSSSPVISRFLAAQETLGSVAEVVSSYVGRTLESGRVPSPQEMVKKGGCGEGCGCHH